MSEDGYSQIYILTSVNLTASRAENILQDFGTIHAMAFDGHWSTQVCLEGLSMYSIDRPVPHAISIIAAPADKTCTIQNNDVLPICGTTTNCDSSIYIGGVIQATAAIDGDQIIFEISKCNGTLFSADNRFISVKIFAIVMKTI